MMGVLVPDTPQGKGQAVRLGATVLRGLSRSLTLGASVFGLLAILLITSTASPAIFSGHHMNAGMEPSSAVSSDIPGAFEAPAAALQPDVCVCNPLCTATHDVDALQNLSVPAPGSPGQIKSSQHDAGTPRPGPARAGPASGDRTFYPRCSSLTQLSISRI